MKLLLTSFAIAFSLILGAQPLPTIGEVFDFDIRDEFHYKSFIPHQPPNGVRTLILDKTYSADSNSVSYRIVRRSYTSQVVWSSPPHLDYTFTTDTFNLQFTDLDSSIYHHDQAFLKDTIRDQDDCNTAITGYDYCVGSFEPICYRRNYGLGLGMVEDYHYDPTSGTNQYVMADTRLVYYKKGGVSCGVADTLGLSTIERRALASYEIYPNPAHDYIYLQAVLDPPRDLVVRIYDSQGKLVHQESLTSLERKVSLKNLNPGLYFLHLQSDDQIGMRTFLKK